MADKLEKRVPDTILTDKTGEKTIGGSSAEIDELTTGFRRFLHPISAVPDPEISAEFQKTFESVLTDRKIKSWEPMRIEDELPYRDFGYEAITKLGQDAVPSFDKAKHLAPTFTGFVRQLDIGEFSSRGTYRSFEEADYAYIRNGKIIYTQLREFDDIRRTKVDVSWREDGFRIDEQYYLFDFPRETVPTLKLRARTAEFILDQGRVRLLASLKVNNLLSIRLDEKRKEASYGGCSVIELEVLLDRPEYSQLVETLKVDPEIFADWPKASQILSTIPNLLVHRRSNIYTGFKDYEYGKGYNHSREVITSPLTISEAVKIAFPLMSQFPL